MNAKHSERNPPTDDLSESSQQNRENEHETSSNSSASSSSDVDNVEQVVASNPTNNTAALDNDLLYEGNSSGSSSSDNVEQVVDLAEINEWIDNMNYWELIQNL